MTLNGTIVKHSIHPLFSYVHKQDMTMRHGRHDPVFNRRSANAWRIALLGGCALCLASCAALPNSGPTEQQILQTAQTPENKTGFHIVPLTPEIVRIAGTAFDDPMSLFTGPGPRANNALIGIGDTLAISIFEAGNSLFSPSSTAGSAQQAAGPSGAASNINLPPQQVDSAGDIFVPYGGRISAAGATPERLATKIEAALAGQSQNPQVLVAIEKNLADTVIVSGDVHSPGRYPLTLDDENLNDVIAIAGGPTHDSADMAVSLARDGQRHTIPYGEIDTNPAQDVTLMPGDRVQLSYNPRSYTVFGAAHVMQVSFNQSTLTLADAIARAGGPSDSQADPNGVFLFRFEPPAISQRLGLPASDTAMPVIYQIDMLQPASYFLAQNFTMRNGDLLYFANAKTNTVSKLFGLIGQLVAPAATGAVVK